MQPWQAFFRKYVPRRFKTGSVIEGANMKMHFGRAFTFARQGGPALGTESAQPAGRRIELRYLPFGYRVGVAAECHEHGDRGTAMPATALAMAPRHPDRFTSGKKSHRIAEAPALELVAHRAFPSPENCGHTSAAHAATSIGKPASFHSGKPSSNQCRSKPCARKTAKALNERRLIAPDRSAGRSRCHGVGYMPSERLTPLLPCGG